MKVTTAPFIHQSSESIERFIEEHAFSLSYDLAPHTSLLSPAAYSLHAESALSLFVAACICFWGIVNTENQGSVEMDRNINSIIVENLEQFSL